MEWCDGDVIIIEESSNVASERLDSQRECALSERQGTSQEKES